MTPINNNQMSEGLNKEVLVSRTLACGCHWEFGKQTKWCKAHGNQMSEELREKIKEILKNRHFLTATVLTENEDGSGTISMVVEKELVEELSTLISHERAEHDKQIQAEGIRGFVKRVLPLMNTVTDRETLIQFSENEINA